MILKSKHGFTYNTEKIFVVEGRFLHEGRWTSWSERKKYKTIQSALDAVRDFKNYEHWLCPVEFRVVHFYPDERYPYCWFPEYKKPETKRKSFWRTYWEKLF